MHLPLFDEFFLDLINNNYSQRSVDNYKRDLEIFDSFLTYKKLSFSKIKKLDISRYKEFLRSGKYLAEYKKIRKNKNDLGLIDQTKQYEKSSHNTSKRDSMYTGRLGSQSVNRMLSTLRTYFRFLNDAEYKLSVLPDSIKLVKTEKKIGHVAELSQLISLVEAPNNFEKSKNAKLRNRAMLELLFSSGMRISELINLNREDLRLSPVDNKITDPRIYVLGKGKKQRFVYMTPRAQKYLELYLQSRKDDFPALFIPYRGLRIGTKDPYIVRISTNYLQAKIKEYRTKLGINVPTSAHSLRHGFATYLAENGANPAAIQKLLGHESLQTTSKYVHSSDRFAEKSHKKHHPLKN